MERDVKQQMAKIREFLRRKDIIFSGKRYGLDALGAMAQGLCCTLLVGTILNTIGQQCHIGFLNQVIVTLGSGEGAVSYTIGGLASAMVGPGIAVAIGSALHAPGLVLFSLIPVGFAVMSFKENRWGGLVAQGVGTSMLQMPNIVRNPRIWIPPTLASMITGPLATCLFKLEMNGAAVNSGMGTCGFCGQIGIWTGWVSDVASGAKAAITPMDWIGMALICFILPAVLSWVFCEVLRKWGWIKENDLKLDL